MLTITKSISLLSQRFNFGVQSFADCICNTVFKIRHNLIQVLMKHPRFFYYRSESTMCSPEVLRLEVTKRPRQSAIVPKITKTLFDSPGTGCFLILPLQRSKPDLMFIRNVIPGIKPGIL
jgi:hypothetical protein